MTTGGSCGSERGGLGCQSIESTCHRPHVDEPGSSGLQKRWFFSFSRPKAATHSSWKAKTRNGVKKSLVSTFIYDLISYCKSPRLVVRKLASVMSKFSAARRCLCGIFLTVVGRGTELESFDHQKEDMLSLSISLASLVVVEDAVSLFAPDDRSTCFI